MTFGLNKKLLIVGAITLLFVASILWFSNLAVTQLSDDIQLSKELSKMDQLVQLMKDQSKQYEQNAPRDYESYNRDLKVYFTQLQENLNTLETLVESTSHSFYNRSGTADLMIGGLLVEKNQQAFKSMEQSLIKFEQGFNEKIGDDLEAPRLEWGNQYILDDESGLFADIAETEMNFEALVQAERQATVNFNWLTIALIAGVMLILLLWFNHTIVKRVIRVAKACREVALGNYGLKIKDQSSDEIGQLVQDFNHLSGRYKSILSLVNQLHIAPTKKQALDAIKSETQSFVNVSNCYFLLPQKDSFGVSLIASGLPQQGLLGKTLLANDTTIENIHLNEHILINDTLSHTINNKQAHFAKYLLNQVNANSVLSIPIKSHNKTAVLIFTRNSKNGFDDTQIQTLISLSPLFANALL